MNLQNFFKDYIDSVANTKKVVSGNDLLIIYYIAIVVFIIFDIYFRRHIKRIMDDKDRFLNENLLRFFKLYQSHGFIFINALLLIIFLGLTLVDEGFKFDFNLLIEILFSFVLFTLLMKLLLRIFVNEDGYSNIKFMRYLHLICYMILGNYFVYLMPFVKYPNIFTAYIGLCFGLICCVYVMIQAIFNPEILKNRKSENFGLSEAYGILKGMVAVVICILLIEYMMIYGCYHSNPALYSVGTGDHLNGWNLFYYLIITFTTIGYGDIYPVVYDGVVYSQLTAVIIGLSSMFTTGCFVAAVISTANSIAQASKDKKTDKNNSSN